MSLLGRISIASCHSVIPSGAPASTAHSLFVLLSSFRLSGSPPLGMRSLLLGCTLFCNPSSLFPFLSTHIRSVGKHSPPFLLIPFLGFTAAHCFTSITLYRLSPEHLLLLFVQHDSIFIPICLSSAGCLRGFAPSVMLNLLHVCGLNAHALLPICAALCLLCLVSTFVY